MNRKYKRKNGDDALSVNERLYTSGLMDKFDAAARLGDRKRMIVLLRQVGLSECDAAFRVNTLLEGHKRLSFWYK
jgi:hypothetical protein